MTISSFIIKLIAIVAMVVDHIGYIFFPEQILFRLIGRLTMPIMTFFAAEGVRRTRNKKIYLARLFAFAVLSEVPFRLAFTHSPDKIFYPSNVIFTIFLGVLSITLADTLEGKVKKPFYRLIPYAICMALAQYFNTDWNWLGVLMIIAFYHAGQSRTKQLIYLGGTYLAYIIAEWFTAWLNGTLALGLWSPVHALGITSLIFIFLYNGKRGCTRPLGYFFYAFYPAHLIILYLIKIFE